MADKLLTTPEVAERARTTVSTVRYWRHTGQGPHGARVGRRVLYREDDVDRRLAGHFTGDARTGS